MFSLQFNFFSIKHRIQYTQYIHKTVTLFQKIRVSVTFIIDSKKIASIIIKKTCIIPRPYGAQSVPKLGNYSMNPTQTIYISPDPRHNKTNDNQTKQVQISVIPT